MRTAEEYSTIYKLSRDKMEAIGKIATMFLEETQCGILNIRGSYIPDSDPRIQSVLIQQDEKWRRFAELIGGIVKADGYEILLQARTPGFYSLLKSGVFQI
jgi:hypothetical protein